MDSFGGEGGFGSLALPLAAFAAGVVAPERTGQALQNFSASQNLLFQQREAQESRAFREKQFAAQEREREAVGREREDIGKTRSQQREAAALEIAQRRAQQQAGQLLPQLQFGRDITVGQPEIPPQFGTAETLRERGLPTMPGVPGFETRGQVPQTVEELRRQIFGLQDVAPEVQGELFEKVLRSGAPVVAPKEPEEVQRARHAIASEQFLAPTVGAVPARRIAALIRSGAAQLPPEVLNRAISGDVRAVDLGQFVQFFDVANGRTVAALQKTPEAKAQVIDDPRSGMKAVLFINPQTRQVDTLETNIPIDQPVDANTARFLAARTQNQQVPNMPAWIAAMPPETALEVLKALGVGAGNVNPFTEEIARRMREAAEKRKSAGGPTTPAPPAKTAPVPAPKPEFDFDPSTGRIVPRR